MTIQFCEKSRYKNLHKNQCVIFRAEDIVYVGAIDYFDNPNQMAVIDTCIIDGHSGTSIKMSVPLGNIIYAAPPDALGCTTTNHIVPVPPK